MMFSRKKLVFCCILSLIVCFGRADTFDAIVGKYKQSKTIFSILAVKADSDKVIYRLRPDEPMIPASNMKLISTSAALHYLGADYIFETKVGIFGRDLVIVGGGDPLLADPKNDSSPCQAANALMDTIINVLRNADISAIDNIIVDTSFFDDIRVHPSWPLDDLNKQHACEVGGLNFYTNCVHLDIQRSGSRAVITMTPKNSYIELINQLTLISKGDSGVGAYRNSVPNKLLVKGVLNQAAGFDVAIENPAGLFASILKDRLVASGISMKGQLLQKYVKQNNNIRYLVVIQTPITAVLKSSNKDSLGLAAECLIKTISAENTEGRINGQWSHGLELARHYLNSLGIPSEQYTLDDGSGLSRNNRLTAACIVTVLKEMYHNKYADVFLSSLAVGGQDGTIAKYFHQSPYKGNIIGKTGYIRGVRSFSGICQTPEGDIFFSILTEDGNSYTRKCINEIAQAIFDGKL